MDRAHRLTRDADFQRVRRDGRSWAHPLLILRASPGPAPTRFGFIVSKKVGKAHDRNRVRRRLREICRSYVPCLRDEPGTHGWAIVIIARPSVAAADFGEVRAAVGQLLGRGRLFDPSRRCGP